MKKHSYRVLEVITPLDVDVSAIIAVVKEKKGRVLRYDMDRDYTNDTLSTKLLIRLYQREVTDGYANSIVEAVENLGVSPKRIRWHPR